MNIKKILIVAAILLALGLVAGLTIWRSQSNVITVTTTTVSRQELTSVVSGTGQIKPKTYVNIGATAFGRITHLNVKEGDHVKRGAVLATIENVQPEATVAAQSASISASKTDITSYAAAESTAKANIAQAKADLEQKKLDYDRAKALYDGKLIAKQDFDSKQAAYDMSQATLEQRQAALAQAVAQTNSARGHLNQAIASQRANYDALDKTIARAPFDGLVTNVPVREGETVVLGIQNAEGSTLMTLADMSVITAEVKVDETDIVNVEMNQPVDVSVDALPGHVFHGHVTQVGDQALLRTTGIATSQSTTGTEEAKDFKVVVTLDQVPNAQGSMETDLLRPGLSATAKITTAHKASVLSIPIQAIVQRDPVAEKALLDNAGQPARASASKTPATPLRKPPLVQGVYVLREDHHKQRTVFVPIRTGVTGATDIEVLDGLSAGQTIVTGRYKVLRTLKSGTVVKPDNSVAETAADGSGS